MSKQENSQGSPQAATDLGIDLDASRVELEGLDAHGRIAWALEHFQPQTALSSSFGAQAAVSLHLATQLWSDIPVILIDTGYLFPETYAFIDELTERLSLNLEVFHPQLSPAWLEKRHGKLWEEGVEGIERYNQIAKVEPMSRALEQLETRAWIAGLRRQQSSSRGNLPVLTTQNGRAKIHPIIDWSDKDVFDYLKKHDLPYHPLWEEGYTSIGDIHTSHKLTEGMSQEDTRFFGLKRECGIHEGADFSI